VADVPEGTIVLVAEAIRTGYCLMDDLETELAMGVSVRDPEDGTTAELLIVIHPSMAVELADHWQRAAAAEAERDS